MCARACVVIVCGCTPPVCARACARARMWCVCVNVCVSSRNEEEERVAPTRRPTARLDIGLELAHTIMLGCARIVDPLCCKSSVGCLHPCFFLPQRPLAREHFSSILAGRHAAALEIKVLSIDNRHHLIDQDILESHTSENN